jgi:hypothetical protein
MARGGADAQIGSRRCLCGRPRNGDLEPRRAQSMAPPSRLGQEKHPMPTSDRTQVAQWRQPQCFVWRVEKRPPLARRWLCRRRAVFFPARHLPSTIGAAAAKTNRQPAIARHRPSQRSSRNDVSTAPPSAPRATSPEQARLWRCRHGCTARQAPTPSARVHHAMPSRRAGYAGDFSGAWPCGDSAAKPRLNAKPRKPTPNPPCKPLRPSNRRGSGWRFGSERCYAACSLRWGCRRLVFLAPLCRGSFFPLRGVPLARKRPCGLYGRLRRAAALVAAQ